MKFAVPKQKVDFFIKILGSLAAPLVNVFLLVPWYENTKTFAPNIGLTIVGWLSTMLLCLILTDWPKPYIWSSRIAEKLLSWVDWLMSDLSWLLVDLSSCPRCGGGRRHVGWMIDQIGWGEGELWGSEDVGELDIDWKWSNIFNGWWNCRLHNLLGFQPGGQLLVNVMGSFRLFIWNS